MTKEQIEELKSRVTHQLEMVRAAPVPEELKNTMMGQTIYLRAGMATPLIVLRLLEEREKLLEALREIRTHVGRALNDGGAPKDGCAHNGEDYFGGECISWAEGVAHPAIAFAEEAAP